MKNIKKRSDKVARNLVDYEVGKTIFKIVVDRILNKPIEQVGLFTDCLNFI